jgi:alpha-methylacyl-CoA racemase
MGPLSGFRVIEMAAIGPAPFCGMMLADMGADVIRIDRKGGKQMHENNPVNRGRRSLALDLKHPDSAALVLDLIKSADALIEGFRPGVMERLGLGPDICMQHNPGLVYGRMTGWGQYGPLSKAAGHDLNYIALTGVLHSLAVDNKPPSPPLNLIGDYGGGGMLLAVGVLAALLETSRSGKGQVIDAAMTDGSASLMSLFYGLKAAGAWGDTPGSNMLDGGAHFYGCYRCADDKYISIGPLEPQFYAELLQRCEISDPDFLPQHKTDTWPQLKARLEILFAGKTREQWCTLLEGTDVCFAPVLDLDEAPAHPHNRARDTFIEHNGVVQPAPAPRFSRTASAISTAPPASGANTREILQQLGYNDATIHALQESGVV